MYIIKEHKRKACYLFACLSVRLSNVPNRKNICSLNICMFIYNLYIQIYLPSDSEGLKQRLWNCSCIHAFWNQRFFKWNTHISSFLSTASWDHEINPATLLAKFGFKMKNCLSNNNPILFQSLFHNLDHFFVW